MTARARIARITQDAGGRVRLEYTIDDLGHPRHGQRAEVSYSAPESWGYVTEHDGRGGSRQVCRGLAHTGDTLCADRARLLNVIRREHRRGRRIAASQVRS